jgi:DNA primase
LLWQRETEGKNFDSPERKATLDKALREKIKLIRDPSIRAHYGEAIKELRWQLFRPQRGGSGKFDKKTGSKFGGKKDGKFQRGVWQQIGAQASTKASLLVSADDARQTHMREAVILASIVSTPGVLDEFEEGLENLNCRDDDHGFLRDLLLRQVHRGVEDLRGVVEDAMGPEPLDFLMGHPHVRLAPPVRFPGDIDRARQTISEELLKLASDKGHRAEVAEAIEVIGDVEDEAVTWRLGQAAAARDKARQSVQEEGGEFETGKNGVSIDKDERAALDALMQGISFSKRKR